MYVRVPEEMQASLLREVRRLRLRSSVVHFPALLLILSAIAYGLLFFEGHAVVRLLRRIVGDALSEDSFWLLLVAVMVLVVAGGTVYILRQMYRDCRIEYHCYCPACQAVDSDDEGECPRCHRALSEKAAFFSTSYSDEEKMLGRYGLLEYTDASPIAATDAGKR
jgi:hypothetical protein